MAGQHRSQLLNREACFRSSGFEAPSEGGELDVASLHTRKACHVIKRASRARGRLCETEDAADTGVQLPFRAGHDPVTLLNGEAQSIQPRLG